MAQTPYLSYLQWYTENSKFGCIPKKGLSWYTTQLYTYLRHFTYNYHYNNPEDGLSRDGWNLNLIREDIEKVRVQK